MNSFKKLLLTKSIFAAAVAAGSAGPAAAQGVLNVLGTQDDGMVCRTGYVAAFDGRSLKCSKTSRIIVELGCAQPGFDTYVARANAGGTPDGEDICLKSGRREVDIDSDDPIGSGRGFTKGVDYVSAKPKQVMVDQKTAERDREEAAAFGGAAADVETVAADAVMNRNVNGIFDRASINLTHFTFAIPTAGRLQGPIGQPATVNSTSAFAPRPLPR
jgi:hypothetical protein